MHMHTLKIAVLEPAEAFDAHPAPGRDGGAAGRAPAPAAPRAPGAVPPQPPAVGHRPHGRPDAPRLRPRGARPGRDGRAGGADRPGRRYAAGPHPPAVGDARVPAVRGRPDRGDHQDAPRPGRRRGRQRAAGQHRRRARRRPAAGPRPTPSRRTCSSRRRPGSQQLRMALVDAVLQIGQLPGLLSRTAKAVAAVLRHRRASTLHGAAPVARRTPAPRSTAPSPPAATSPPPRSRSHEIKEVQRAHGVTMNDVVLAVVGGALRRWLRGQGELPERSLVAGVPVATDVPGVGPAARRQPGLEHLHLARDRHRRPARSGCGRSRGPPASPS